MQTYKYEATTLPIKCDKCVSTITACGSVIAIDLHDAHTIACESVIKLFQKKRFINKIILTDEQNRSYTI